MPSVTTRTTSGEIKKIKGGGRGPGRGHVLVPLTAFGSLRSSASQRWAHPTPGVPRP